MRRGALICLVLALLVAGADQVSGQDRPPTREARDTARQDTATQDTLPPPRPAYQYTPPVFALILSVGRPGSGLLQTQPVLARQRDLAGTVVDSAGLGRTLTARGGANGSISGVLSLGPTWALRVGASFARWTVEAEYEGDDDAFVAAASAITGDGIEIQSVAVESAIRYRIPSTRRFQPFVELGGVLSRWSTDGDLPGTGELTAGVTRVQATAGFGGTIPLTDVLSVRVLASTRVFQTPVRPLAAGDTLASSSSLLLTTQEPAGSRWGDSAQELLGLLRLELGISLDLGRVEAPPPGPVEAPDTTSIPDR